MKNALLVEDEEFALEDLKDSLQGLMPSLDIHTARNASEAMEALQASQFDVIFLDIELPGMTGIQLLEQLEGPVPPVVLVTAHALHALDAFGLGVIECLLKPVDYNRLQRVLEKIQKLEAARLLAPNQAAGQAPHFGVESHVLFREGHKVWFVKVGHISRLRAEGHSTRLFFPHGAGVVARSLDDLESRLDPGIFFRANAEDIINLNAVDHISSAPTGHLIAHFSDGLEISFTSERSRVFEREHRL